MNRVGPRVVSGAVVLLIWGWLAHTLGRIWQRVRFPYELVQWADDYFMTMALRLDAGGPLYEAPAQASSWIYSPGMLLLHALLLAPLGLNTSLLANRVLVLLTLAGAVLVAHKLAAALGRCEPFVAQRLLPEQVLALTGGLAVVAVANPVADALHPTALELLILSAAALTAHRWPQLSSRSRTLALVLLPLVAIFFKQTSAVAVTATCVVLALTTEVAWSKRLRAASLPGLGASAGLGTLLALSGGQFWSWGYRVPNAAPFQSWKTADILGGWGVALLPFLLVWLARLGLAIRQRDAGGRAYLRASLPALFYTPLALVALFKRLGGPNNLALLGFLYASLTLPLFVSRASRGRWHWRTAHALAIGALLLPWLPNKRVPDQRDHTYAETLCALAAKRTQCGERVWLARGVSCLARGGVRRARDRALPLDDVLVAEQPVELTARLRREEYDLLLVHVHDILNPRWKPVLDELKDHYAQFAVVAPGQKGDQWREGWDAAMGQPVMVFERRNERGRHPTDDGLFGCQ